MPATGASRALVPLVAVAVGLLAGCGDDGGRGVERRSTSTSTSTSTTVSGGSAGSTVPTTAGAGGSGSCTGPGPASAPPTDAARVVSITADVDGDGAADDVTTYASGTDAAPGPYRLVVTLAAGSRSALDLGARDPVVAVAPLGATDLGGGGATVFVRTDVGASADVVSLFAVVDCAVVPVADALGAPSAFAIGGSVVRASGLACRDADGDGSPDLVVLAAESVDAQRYSTSARAFGRVGAALDASAAGGWSDSGTVSVDDPALGAYYGLDCPGVDTGIAF